MSNITTTTTEKNLDYEQVKKHFFPSSAKEEEVQYCFKVAKELQLSPFRNEIYFVPRPALENGNWVNKIQPMPSRDGFLAIAHKHEQFDGFETLCEDKEVLKLVNGEWKKMNEPVAVCKVFRKDKKHPFVVEVNFSEYVGLTKDGRINATWSKMPLTMLKKVAESQALRKAFSIGYYTYEEMETVEDYQEIVSNVQIENKPTVNMQSSLDDFLSKNNIVLKKNQTNEWLEGENLYNHRTKIKEFGFLWDQNAKVWYRPIVGVEAVVAISDQNAGNYEGNLPF